MRWLPAALVLGAAGCGCEDETAHCSTKADCPTGLVCAGGACQGCAGTGDCGPDEVCALARCLPDKCTSDGQCRIGRRCLDGACDWEARRCLSDQECAAELGRQCLSGLCGRPEGAACRSDSECWRHLVCRGGRCAKPPVIGCRADDSCGEGRICDANLAACIPAPGDVCDSAADCTSAARPYCVGSRTCVACLIDQNCPAGLLCEGQACVTPCCTSNAQCRYGRVCAGCVCGDPPACAAGAQACIVDRTCPAGQVCQGGCCTAAPCPDGVACGSGGTCSGGECHAPLCGNGVVETGEECDGTTDCTASCRIAARPIPPAPIAGRQEMAVAWTGERLLVWGGYDCSGFPDDGAAYDPSAGEWTPLPAGPLSGREGPAFAWTGAELVVWGGWRLPEALGDGARYADASSAWVLLPAAPLSARWQWGGMLVPHVGGLSVLFGGKSGGDFFEDGFSDGARWDPRTGTWEPMAAAPLSARWGHRMVGVGDAVLVWGGADGAGALYLPAEDRWQAIAPTSLAARRDFAAVWTGAEVVIWGGVSAATTAPLGDGARWSRALDRWLALPPAPIAPRHGAFSAWTGREVLIWGGNTVSAWSGSSPAADGAAYEPAADRWRPLSGVPLAGRYWGAAAWTGERMLVWGGRTASGCAADGAAIAP